MASYKHDHNGLAEHRTVCLKWKGIGREAPGLYDLGDVHTDESVTQKTQLGVHRGTVNVDVDILNPFITSVKQTALDTWRRLPPQAQLALPFVATGATTGIIVAKIQGGRLRKQVLLHCTFARTCLLPWTGLQYAMVYETKSVCRGLEQGGNRSSALSIPADGEERSSAGAD